MIDRDSLIEVGKVLKTHGISGEMSVLFTVDGFDGFIRPGACLMFDIDGIIVPFFVSACRPRGGESLLVTLDGEDTQEQAAVFVGKPVYMDADDVPEDPDLEEDGEGVYANDLIGYRAVATDGTDIGEISGVDDNTDNVLFVVARDGGSDALIPAVDEMIEDIDEDNRIVTFNLPQGLLDI